MAATTQTRDRQDPPNPKSFAKTREWAKAADPFFWLVLVGAVPAVLVAWQVAPERPGGGEVDPKDPALQEASEGAAEFEEETRGGLRDLTEAVAVMNGRVSALEDRRLGERLTALEDREVSRRGDPTPDGDAGVRRACAG